MREEEKLAGDVYQALFAVWGLPIFDNIQQAEQTHTVAVKTLLDRYDPRDPAADAAPGEFENATIQNLYNDLVYSNLERGSRNHLRAFSKQLGCNGASYTPVHLDQAAYDAIVGNPTERGR